MENKVTRFFINGVETSDQEYNIVIPIRYKPLFEGHRFPSLEILSKALMFAGCADEARCYGMWWMADDDERTLKNYLKL